MKCIICNSNTSYYFSKYYSDSIFSFLIKDINKVDYYKCENCGFTISKTHYDLPKDRWEKLNYEFHDFLGNNEIDLGMPPYLEQAKMLNVLSTHGLIDMNSSLDFAGGKGSLSDLLDKSYNIKLSIYEPFIQNNARDIYVQKKELEKYKIVLSSALFEHLTKREYFDQINSLVDDEGCMMINTIVCENIPKDPDWFYLDPPVHCAFHTNKSMEILMDIWGYKSSIYCPPAKSWILFKKDSDVIKIKINEINRQFYAEYLIHKVGFVDFWKGF